MKREIPFVLVIGQANAKPKALLNVLLLKIKAGLLPFARVPFVDQNLMLQYHLCLNIIYHISEPLLELNSSLAL